MLDVHELVITHSTATYIVRVDGELMVNAAIWEGDVLVVEKAIYPIEGSIIVVSLNGAFTVHRLRFQQGEMYLMPENLLFQPINITEDVDCQVF